MFSSTPPRPQVDESARLDPPGFYLVEFADAVRFGLQFLSEGIEPLGPIAFVQLELPEFLGLIAELQPELRRIHAVMPGGCCLDVFSLSLQDFTHRPGF